jgi:sugar/nucleoside kinase (ribokinase family)
MDCRTDFDILVVGEINVDLVLTGDVRPAFGQAEKLVDDAKLTLGSSGVIFACGAARLGLRVAFSGVVGHDLFGTFMLEGLQARGIDTEGVVVDPELRTGLSIILSRPQDRAILTYVGAINRLRAGQVRPGVLRRARHVHVSSYYLQDALRPGLPALFKQAHDVGLTTSLDTNWDPAEKWNGAVEDALAGTDVFLPNGKEACAISGSSSVESALEYLASRVPTVAIKLGEKGAIAQRGGERVACPAFPVAVKDTTGAGDSFDAGFFFGLLSGASLEGALRMGCACGALSTRAPGGTNAQPDFDEVQALLQ